MVTRRLQTIELGSTAHWKKVSESLAALWCVTESIPVMQNDGLCLFTAEVDTPAVLPRSQWNGKRVTIVWNLRIDNSRYDVSEDTEPNDYALWRIY